MSLAALYSVIDNLGPNNTLLALPFCLVINAIGLRGKGRGGVPSPDVIARVGVVREHAVASARRVDV
jgi:hypothetical protein